MTGSLFDAFSAIFTHRAAADFIEVPGGARWTYGHFAAQVDRYAAILCALGAVPGERVLAELDKSPYALAVYAACMRIGAVYVPLNTDYTEAEVRYFLDDAEPRIAVVRPESAARMEAMAQGKKHLAIVTLAVDGSGTFAATPPSASLPAPPASGDALAALLYTSGTTGRPKGAMMRHGNLLANARSLVALWHFTAEDVLIHALPIFHTHGLFVAVHCVLLSGSRMLFLPRFDADSVIALLPRASTYMGVPTHYTRLLGHAGLTRKVTAGMRLFVSGSAPLSAETFRTFETRCGQPILERYGMTETGMLTSNPYEGPRRAGFVGAPLPDVDLRIADPETGRALPRGEVGVVEVKGPNVFAGYWRNDEKTRSAFRADGYFITGDLGRIDGDGAVELVGRAHDLIITGGFNVYPKEVEAALEALPGVDEAAVIAVPHPDFGEAVVAVLKGKALDEDEVRRAVRSSLTGYKIPKRVICLDELPRNAMGKVQKSLLRARFANLFAEGADR